MRTKVGWGIGLLGALLALLGLAMMVILGPDGRIKSGPHPVETGGIAIVTAPKTLSWAGVQMSVLAELPVNKPVFVGLGNTVDVENYVKDTERIEVTAYESPWSVKTRDVKGKENLPAAPTALDWWLDGSAGLGGASIDTTLPDETVSLAILSVGFSNLRGLEVTVAYGIKGGFAKGIGFLMLGLGGLWFGRMVRRGEGFVGGGDEFDDEEEFAETEEIEEVVYVYIDDDGVEHEISEEEAANYDVDEVIVEEFVVDEEGDEVGELPPEPEPEPGPEPKPAPNEPPVVYVYVDEHGVEHEISEDELDDYEFVDDEEEEPR